MFILKMLNIKLKKLEKKMIPTEKHKSLLGDIK